MTAASSNRDRNHSGPNGMAFPMAMCRSGGHELSPTARMSRSTASHAPRKMKVGRSSLRIRRARNTLYDSPP